VVKRGIVPGFQAARISRRLEVHDLREAHGTQLNDLWWYTEQLARWQRARPTPAQQQELERLTHQLTALRRVLTASLALAEELQAGTIEKVLAKDDVELSMEFLLGKRRP
jgi:hypothetical protein